MNSYEAKQQERKERYLQLAEQAEQAQNLCGTCIMLKYFLLRESCIKAVAPKKL